MLFPVGVLCDYLRVFFFLVVIQDGFSAVIFLSMTSLAVNIQTITVLSYFKRAFLSCIRTVFLKSAINFHFSLFQTVIFSVVLTD